MPIGKKMTNSLPSPSGKGRDVENGRAATGEHQQTKPEDRPLWNLF